ncbi:hypothetical protein NQZ70_02889 [Sorangium sp. Soce836]|nr:hypothetical protein NQZ70_02889 [Sorangium sp. Soce836]
MRVTSSGAGLGGRVEPVSDSVGAASGPPSGTVVPLGSGAVGVRGGTPGEEPALHRTAWGAIAPASAATVPSRRSGSFSRQRRIVASRSSGMSSRSALGGTGSPCTIAEAVSKKLPPSKGILAVSS